MANTLEDEIKKVSESPDFASLTMQDKLVTFSRKLLNIPYKFAGNTILGIDCSAYVKNVYGLWGVELPRTAREQFNEGQQIDREELSIGDLVFFRTYASFPSHVGIYLGNNLFIHASSKGKRSRSTALTRLTISSVLSALSALSLLATGTRLPLLIPRSKYRFAARFLFYDVCSG